MDVPHNSFPRRSFQLSRLQASRFGPFPNSRYSRPAALSAVRLHNEHHRAADSALIHGAAGAAGALIALVIVYPIDRLRVQIQCSRQRTTLRRIWQQIQKTVYTKGISGLYGGLSSGIYGVGISWAIYYYLYSYSRGRVKQWRMDKCGNMENLLISLLAGAAAAIVSNPIWVVNTRAKLQQTNQDDNFFKNVWRIIREEGIDKLFAGLGPSLILLINPAIQFTIYERLKSMLKSRRSSKLPQKPSRTQHPSSAFAPVLGRGGEDYLGRSFGSRHTNSAALNPSTSMFGNTLSRPRTKLSSLDHFVIGSVSKFVALLVSYPLQVVKARAHARELFDTISDSKRGTNAPERHREGSVRSFFRLIEADGLVGLYRGLGSKLVASTLTAAVMFTVYEKLVSILSQLQQHWDTEAPTGQTISATRLRRRTSGFNTDSEVLKRQRSKAKFY